MIRKYIYFTFALGALLTVSFNARGQVSTQPVVTGLASPILVTNAKDGSNRLFIAQQRGLILVKQPNSTGTTTFIDLTSKVSSSGSERGLLGLAFHPQFVTNSFFFVNYTRQSDGATIVARYRAINGNTQGDLSSERIIMTIAQPFSNHNGGMIEFGPDGHLYIGTGDGGSGNDPGNRAQNINDLLGKMLRITPSLAEPLPNPAYTNPPDNPYVGVAGADEIYAIGLRNPWRWSFDRGGTNQLWAGDVGQNAIEEISLVGRGNNYGWRPYEGTQCTNLDPNLCTGGTNPIPHTPPIHQYNHTSGRCSITGGYVYRGARGTMPQGSYVYSDYCTGEVWSYQSAQSPQVPLFSAGGNVSSFGEDEAGEIYVVVHNGSVLKIVNNSLAPLRPVADFDGDGRTDVSVCRQSESRCYYQRSSNGSVAIVPMGANMFTSAPGDFDGDGLSDATVFQPTGTWNVARSSQSNALSNFGWGIAADLPTQADYDGDRRADYAVFRPSTGVWWVLRSTNSTVAVTQFGASGDRPTQGDYDGDLRADIGVYRPSTGVWYSLNSFNGAVKIGQWGISEDIPVNGDYDGDGFSDLAVFRPSTGEWYIRRTIDGGFTIGAFGTNGDIPVPGDYDGDGRADLAIFRPSTGTWWGLRSNGNSVFVTAFGLSGDQPMPAFERR
jgi:hypothetical protein